MKNALVKLFAAVIILTVASCNSDNGKQGVPDNAINPDVMKNPATAAAGGNKNNNLPVFEFNEETHDFGTMMQGEKIAYAFRFKNAGKSDLVIRAANGSCGCTVPEWPKDPIAPGKEGIINITFNSEGKEGMQHKTVTLIANTMPNTKVLTITGEVIKPAGK